MYTKTKLRRKQDPNKFEQIYAELENIYEINFADIAKKVNNRLKTIIFVMIIATILLLITLIQATTGTGTIDVRIPIIGIALILLSPLIYTGRTPEEKNFVKDFKMTILDKLVKSFSKELTFHPVSDDKNSILDCYKEIGFDISQSPYYSIVDDVIDGKMSNGNPIRISELLLRKRSGDDTVTIFQGLFVETDLAKNTYANICVIDQHKALVDAKNYTKLELESSEFEKLFNVYTNNHIAAAQLLTSDTLTKLSKLCEDYGMIFDFVIKNNKLYIRFEVGNMFESIQQKNRLDKEDTFVYYSIINYILLVVDEINKIVDESGI